MSGKITITLAIIALLALAGCAMPPDDAYDIPDGVDMIVPTPHEPGTSPVTASTAEIREAADANNQFAIDIYSELSGKEGNVFFSPYSISTALAMTYEGAREETAEEIAEVFHFSQDDETRRESFTAIQNTINRKSDKYKLHTANAIWAQKDYPFLANYTDALTSVYSASLGYLDFVHNTEVSRKIINDWVEDRTNDKITNLLPPGSINQMTRLVLTNAIYFKGDWVKKFDRKKTTNMPFRVSDDKTVDVPMMRRTDKGARFNYAQTANLQILEMLYDGGNLSMLVLLPMDDIEQLEEELTAEKLDEWKGLLRERRIDVYMPKFQFTQLYSLSNTLADMGMPLAFTPDEADFSGMDSTRRLFIHNVFHKAFVDVNEEGTEAAAATGVVVGITGIMESFRADHPFIFIIQEKTTGSILFMGKVSNPAE